MTIHLGNPGSDQSGNPKGRPKGLKDAINKAFIDDLAKVWSASRRRFGK